MLTKRNSVPPVYPAHRFLTQTLVFCYILFSIILFPRLSVSEEKPATLAEAMTQHLACYPLELIDFHRQKPLIDTKEFCLATIYHETGAQPLWVTPDGPGKKALIIVDFLNRVHLEGLDPVDYEFFEINNLWNSLEPSDLAQLDTLLTYNLVKYIHDMSFGQSKFRTSNPELFAEAGNIHFDPVYAIETARMADDFAHYLESLAPSHRYYRNLKDALAHIRAQPQDPDWRVIPGGGLIKPGKSDPRIPLIRQRLAADINPEIDEDDATRYNQSLVEAITYFQQNYGLKTDGIIGPQTLAALNISRKDKIDMIRANLARWRWQDHELGSDYVMVNIADFSLTSVKDNEIMQEMPVIVGKQQHQTPVFSDKIKYLDFNPFWNITPNIARNVELPALRKNPNHLVERNIRLFSNWQEDGVELDSTTIDWQNTSRSQMSRYKLRQDPGPWNALGRVKFVFPNQHSVYLHDTPTRNLFEESLRSFSYGCIRVSQPLVLAHFMLQLEDPLWSAEKIDAIVSSGKRKVIRLSNPLPVHMTYQTVWLDNQGMIHFNNDIYNRDTKLLDVLLN